MDWVLPVNEVLKDDITKINHKLMPPNFKGDIRSIRVMQDSISRLIDVIGEQSAAAQGLNRTITSGDKLRDSPTHILYLLKDGRAKGGKGEVIGLLKIGHKHLFLFNEMNKVCEVEPICVLDFFVLKDRQRAGYGKILFDYMLQDIGAVPKELAIDGPSTKMEQFLSKNYGVDVLKRQNNNFAVSPEFFKLVPTISKSGRCTPVESSAIGRFAAPKPPSAVAAIIHGGNPYYEDDRDEASEAYLKTGKGSPRDEQLFAPSPLELAPVPKPKPEPKAEPEPMVVAEIVANTTKSPERPSTLSVEPIAETGVTIPAVSPAGSTISRRDSQLTEQGFFDVKFYHNKLW